MKTIVTAFILLFGTIIHAQENPLGITFFGSFIHSDKVPNALFFFSKIEKSDSFELRRAMRTHDIDTIVLASDGGSVWEALTMAGVIFDKKMTVYIPKLPDEKGCYSACAFMFFAGQTRLAEGFLAVHQVGAYNEVVDAQKEKLGETQQEIQFTTSEIIGFLNEFGTPPWVYERMFRSRELYFFSVEEKATLNSGVIDGVQKRDIDNFLVQLRNELENLPKDAEPSSPSIVVDLENHDVVRDIQVLLNEARCSAGGADGVWGSQTDAAASKFASANELNYSGPASIDKPFIDLLRSKKYKLCPAPVTAAPAKVATSAPGGGTPTLATPSARFAMPVSGNIVRNYRPPQNEGIDIVAATGTPVLAAADGTVASIYEAGQAHMIMLRHDDALLTVYAGTLGIKVKRGDYVSRGQTIATVLSGNPAFLHFEVRRGVESTDPMLFLQ